MYLTQPILPLLSEEFHVGPARAGLTVSSVVLAIAAAATVYGPLSDALGRRRVMAGAMALLALATLACAFATSFGGLVALRALQGLFVPGMTAVVVAYAGDRFAAADLSRVVGGVIGASVVGGLVGRVGAGYVTAHHGWRVAFELFAALTLLAAIGLRRELTPARTTAGAGFGEATRGMLRHLGEPRLLGGFLVGASLFFGWIGIFTYLPYHLVARWGLGTGPVSSVYLVYAAGVVASPLAGRLTGRFGARRLIGLGLLVEGLGMAATLAGSLPVMVAGLVVLVLGTFTAQAVAPAFVNQSARTAKGGASALYLTFYYLGGTAGSVVPGLAWEAWGWPGVVLVCGAGVVAGLLANALLCGRDSVG
jgi:YNFM family putative membrane transporter